ncbi:hypothetical protein XI00_17340 [Bradyrhizobium sp. CCBAU 21359]|nr:hypothetical protein [Bradyrhizobium sp. CCBAU 21359]
MMGKLSMAESHIEPDTAGGGGAPGGSPRSRSRTPSERGICDVIGDFPAEMKGFVFPATIIAFPKQVFANVGVS